MKVTQYLSAVPVYVLLIIVGMFAIYLIGRWDRGLDDENARLDRQTKASLVLAKASTERYFADLKAHEADSIEIVRLEGVVGAQEAAADSIGREIDSLPVPELDDAGGWRVRYKLRTLQVAKLEVVIDNLKARAIILERDRDRAWVLADSAYVVVIPDLVKALKDERDARQCRILGLIPCPSRTLSYALGAATALVVVVAKK